MEGKNKEKDLRSSLMPDSPKLCISHLILHESYFDHDLKVEVSNL